MMNPYYITGLVEGEGWFGVSISCSQKEELNAGAQVSLNFGINMNGRELDLLTKIRDYFECGTLEIRKNGMVQYRVRKFSDIVSKIIPFFNKYPFIGGKMSDFHYFKIIAQLMSKKKHLTVEGVEMVRNIKNSFACLQYAP